MRLRDTDIRHALDHHLRRQHRDDPTTLIRHELGLCAGSRRVDVAVLNGEMAGYEIKSDEDTLVRLAGQAHAYSLVLDRAILVTTTRHKDKVTGCLPNWWGVMTASVADGAISLEVEREPERNDALDPFAVAQLLWREEALAELRARGLGRGLSKKARYYVWQELSESVELAELCAIVRQRLKARPEWPGGLQHEQGDEKSRRPATP